MVKIILLIVLISLYIILPFIYLKEKGKMRKQSISIEKLKKRIKTMKRLIIFFSIMTILHFLNLYLLIKPGIFWIIFILLLSLFIVYIPFVDILTVKSYIKEKELE